MHSGSLFARRRSPRCLTVFVKRREVSSLLLPRIALAKRSICSVNLAIGSPRNRHSPVHRTRRLLMLVLVTLVLMFVLMLMTMFLDGNRRTGIRDRARETEQDQQRSEGTRLNSSHGTTSRMPSSA